MRKVSVLNKVKMMANIFLNIKLIPILVFLSVTSLDLVYSQNIVVKYVGSSSNSINLRYNYRELSDNYTVLNKDNRYLVIKSNKEQTIMCDDAIRSTLIYAQPNDTIEIDLNKKGLITYSSKNSVYRKIESEFINSCYEKYGPAKDLLSKKRWLLNHKQINPGDFLDENYYQEIQLLDKYHKDDLISNQFYKYFKSLYWSLSIINKIQNPKKVHGTFLEINNSLKNSDYLTNIPEYRIVLLNYTLSLMKKLKIKNDLFNTLQFISAKFSNQSVIDCLLYNRMKFCLLYQNVKIDKKSIALFQNKCKNTLFVEEISKDLSTDKKSVILNDILKKYDGKLVFVDFWASWCAPCRAEFPYEKKLMEMYPKLSFAFISTDKSRTSWEKASQEYPDILNQDNNFFLGTTSGDALLKEINVSSIPRYILVSKEGKIINADAPRPSNPKLKILIEESLNK
ncbi:TlpA family protein disulfide reductase [Flavobacterium sp. GT3P67]|uniref:TlpA family protein disulfide reductase n=1 Tax=Flavobacterium sp. GT3P67 TaxID=2541722 RepID=UPI00104B8758|nr:TlpA disulfide reductase family protein [Flavobacterium sp. GT3P67]TDE52700.1 TlpA family protein disulfide reductase [Flavobacterium sp. GT3P67]